MAAVLEQGGGRRAVQFRAPGLGKSDKRDRLTLYLGHVSRAHADIVRGHIDHLLAAIATRRTPPWETTDWVANAGPKLHAKLVRYGLVPAREEEKSAPLAAFLDGYILKRTDLKPRTVANLKQARGSLVDFFGESRDIRTVTRGEAKDWHRSLSAKLARATVAMHVKKARQFFGDAMDRKLVADNPFRAVKAGSQTNESRMVYVPAADVLKVIDATDDPEWRLLFALGRFGGLRVPSETTLLLWTDVDFDRGRFTVTSPKTAHHEGKGTRDVPIFPELRPFMEEAKAAAPAGARHVFVKLRGENLRTQAGRLVEAAGLEPWGKLFQNMRSSRETDLTASHPLHVVCAWIGNSEAVARKHYLQVTEDHFSAASGGAGKSAANSNAGTSGQESPRIAGTSQKQGFSEQTQQAKYPQGESNAEQNDREKPLRSKHALPQTMPFEKSPGKTGVSDAESADLSHVTRAGRMRRAAGRAPSLEHAVAGMRELAGRGEAVAAPSLAARDLAHSAGPAEGGGR